MLAAVEPTAGDEMVVVLSTSTEHAVDIFADAVVC